jgi:prepilin-type N-terminal cleavage/methylation domain-containing protein
MKMKKTRRQGDKEKGRRQCCGRSAFTLIEIMVVMLALGMLLMLGAVLIGGTLRIRQAATTAFNHLNARTALADQFRADVDRAISAPDRAGTWTAGPTCLVLRQRDSGHIIYSWKDGRLERFELPGGKSQRLPLGLDGAAVEFLRPDADRRVVTLRLSPQRPRGSDAPALEIAAALGGDRR